MVIIHKDFRLRLDEINESHLIAYSDKRLTLLSLFEDCPPPKRSKKKSLGIPWKWEVSVSRGRAAAVIGGVTMNITAKLKKNIRRKNEPRG